MLDAGGQKKSRMVGFIKFVLIKIIVKKCVCMCMYMCVYDLTTII